MLGVSENSQSRVFGLEEGLRVKLKSMERSCEISSTVTSPMGRPEMV